jgi:hypothetical protein
MSEVPEWVTVKQLVERNPAFCTGGIRWLIFNRRQVLEKGGILTRLGRRILIDEPKFLIWVRDQFHQRAA